MTNHKPALLFALAATASVGCSDMTETTEYRVNTASAAIAGGTIDTADTAVVGVAQLSQMGFGGCTGSLLAPNVVLTALHCVASTPAAIECPSNIFAMNNASDMYVTTQTSFPQSQNGWNPVREIVVSPFNGLCGRDVAILILQSPISAAEATPLLPRLTPVVENEIYSAVGFGEQGEGGPSLTRMRRDNLSVLCVAIGCGAPQFVYPKEWVGETGVCSGDSGGPSLDAQGRVTGVASRGAPMCESPLYGDVFGHISWIQETTIYAAGLNGTTPPPWATDPVGAGAGGGGPGTTVGAGGAGAGVGGAGATGTTGSGNAFVPGDTEDKKYEGNLVSSCAMVPNSGGPGGLGVLLLGLGFTLAGRRRG